MLDPLPTEKKLTADRLAQYVKRNRCERFLRFSLFASELDVLARRYGIQREPLSPLLSESGQSYEGAVIEELKANGASVVDLTNKPAAEFVSLAQTQETARVFYYQTKLAGRLGKIACEGVADLISLEKLADEKMRAVVVDIKSSRRETTGYRLQVAFYARLLRQVFGENNLLLTQVRGAIHLKNKQIAPDSLEGFDLSLYFDEIERLVERENSDVERIARTPLAETAFHLNYNCDGCAFNSACFVNAAECEDLSLVPNISASEKAALRREGFGKLAEIARLFEYGDKQMREATPDASRVNKNRALNGKMPVIAQRARAALHRFDKSIEFRPYLIGANFGTLPDTARYPQLVRVFIDTQNDYLNDRLYLFSAVVASPARSIEICEVTQAPPDDESERQLLIRAIQKTLKAISETADATHAPVHFYLFDRRSQEKLKAALTRHFAALCAIPAFYDLLTASPALTQLMISFLAEDTAARSNLKNLNQNLYQTAGEMKFDWTGGERRIKERFRAKIFDNFRKFERAAENGELRFAEAGDGIWIESAARFGTEIPLEYAYAAWGELKEDDFQTPEAKRQIAGFLGATVDELKDLAILRCRALQHIEESFGYKNRDIEKQELNLEKLHEIELDAETVLLARAIEDFLFLEHHARRQESFLFFALPPDIRAATGRTAILRCENYEKTEDRSEFADFIFSNSNGEQLESSEQKMLRFRPGDWVVLNDLRGENNKFLSAKQIVNGRLAIIEAVEADKLRLRLMSITFKNSSFRYWHRQKLEPLAGSLYTIDEMLDDLNSDKFLAACRSATATNALYRWITEPETGAELREIRPSRLRTAKQITKLANQAQQPHDLTPAQRNVIGGLLGERIFVLQGPPGTGKSHTLGFAILARILALRSAGKPFRVSVSAKTHAAVNIALASIAKRAKILLEKFPDEPVLQPLKNLAVFKLCRETSEILPDGVTALCPDGDDETSAARQWDKLSENPILIVGGTPGMIYNLVKKGASRGKEINWAAQYFDLVVVDEASQMGLAEALTAAAFLKSDGQFVAIGDHRQMPPILAHAWDRESRRDLERIKPHLSIFEFLRESGFVCAALDESFRIPAEIAAFLGNHIYAADGVDFHSRHKRRLAQPENLTEDWLQAVFATDAPVVLIEHGETNSAHANEFEAFLVEQIARTATEQLNLCADKGIGIVVPHRAQKALLQTRLPALTEAIDTVERFQGGERDLIIVSATVSDRDFASAESEFLLEPRRLTVAISRPKRKLVVIASSTIFDLIPTDLDEYERGALWKLLNFECRQKTLWSGNIENFAVRISGM